MNSAEYNAQRLDMLRRADELDAEQLRVDREAPGTVEQLRITVARRDGYAALSAELEEARRLALASMVPMTPAIH